MNINRRSFLTTLAGLGVAITALPETIQAALKTPGDVIFMPDETAVANDIFVSMSGRVQGPAYIYELMSSREPWQDVAQAGIIREATQQPILNFSIAPGGVLRWLACSGDEIFVPEGEAVLNPNPDVAVILYYQKKKPAYVAPGTYHFNPDDYEYNDEDDDEDY